MQTPPITETVAILDERGEPIGYVTAEFDLEMKLDENQADVVCLSVSAPELGGKRTILAVPKVMFERLFSRLGSKFRLL